MKLPSWNLNEFYSSLKDEQINKDILILKNKINLFAKKYRGKLKDLSKKMLIQTLKDFEEIEELCQKLKSYAYLQYCTDQLNNKKSKFFSI